MSKDRREKVKFLVPVQKWWKTFVFVVNHWTAWGKEVSRLCLTVWSHHRRHKNWLASFPNCMLSRFVVLLGLVCFSCSCSLPSKHTDLLGCLWAGRMAGWHKEVSFLIQGNYFVGLIKPLRSTQIVNSYSYLNMINSTTKPTTQSWSEAGLPRKRCGSQNIIIIMLDAESVAKSSSLDNENIKFHGGAGGSAKPVESVLWGPWIQCSTENWSVGLHHYPSWDPAAHMSLKNFYFTFFSQNQ